MPDNLSRRRFITRTAGLGAASILGPGLLAACASPDAGLEAVAGPPQRGGRLTFARTADILELDPAAVSDNPSIWAVQSLFGRLYTSSPTGGQEPSLAESYQVSADQREWTFQLRPGLRFSDGTPLTAADVKFSIDRCTKSDANGYMNTAIASVHAVGNDTVVIRTKTPVALLGVASYYGNGIVPNDFGGRREADFFRKPVTSGPFSVVSWEQGQRLLLRRNTHHWQPGKPYLDEVALTVVPDDNGRMLQLRGRQADIVEAPPWPELADLRHDSGLAVRLFGSTRVDFLLLNLKTPQFTDVHVRRAMTAAIDRTAIVRTALFGNGSAAGSMFSPSWPGYDSSITAPVRDLDLARRELAASGYPHGFHTDHMIDGGDTVQATVAQIVQSNLKQIGIEVKILQYDSSTIADFAAKGDFRMYHDVITLDISDPDENVPYLFDPAAGGDGANAAYKDPQVIAWSRQAGASDDTKVRNGLYRSIQQRVADTVPMVPLCYIPFGYAQRRRVQGFNVLPTGDYRLEEVWLAR